MSPTSEQYDSLLRQMWERMDEGCGETIYVIGQGSGEHSFPFTLFFKNYLEHISHLLPIFLISVCRTVWEDIKVSCDNVNSHLFGHNMLDLKDSLSKRFYRCFFSASICIKGNEAQSKGTPVPGIEQATGLEFSLPLQPTL